GRVAFLRLEDGGDLELGMRRRLAAGELAGQRLPGGDGLVKHLLKLEALSDLEEDLRDAAIQRVLRRERLPGRAGLGILLAAEMVVGGEQLSIEDGALGVGRLRPVGILSQVALE